MTKLSVNINKVATIRNARGGNVPNILTVAMDCEKFGADGITVHPRPDERHIRFKDVYDLRGRITTEFNIEGYPSPKFMELVINAKPTQVTLVPDAPDAITSNAGWDTQANHQMLSDIVDKLQEAGIRSSIFVDADPVMVEYAAKTGTDRIELYTEPYAERYAKNREEAITPFVEAAKMAKKLGLGLNAGHDLSLENLHYLYVNIPWIDEVSIGHALISDALYMGLEKTIAAYKDCLKITDNDTYPLFDTK
ncbi:pyridoxine 5'-phosphate synthase [Dysgonomonas sp. 25]|uniref:pyridoxine 5'-phosphate synthase n=1 Tax=Dysgonomonas sp. 25 TaxID=2302933 RepID=UPI0013D83E83|nr:pyridoxine 5'-phosphate synthase [Dysgonomonas sp. 25]NDV70320.1 pyridoxine 5'-phosphate synthase [Dysgonomonas sp. 25]